MAMAEIATIKKLEEQLNCAICLETYKDPKLLQCFHIYCRQCLVKLVVRDQQGQLSLTCPTCRQATPIPANGVTGLQSAFQVNHLLEILEQYKKSKDTAGSQEGVKCVVTHPIPTKKVANCFEHKDKERELYCETCADLICFKCVIKGGEHHDHEYHLLDEAFEKYKGKIAPSLEPMEAKMVAVKEALVLLDKQYVEISDQRNVIEADIHNKFKQVQETLDIRKTELISQLHQITQTKLKDLAVQKDQMETILAQLSSCLDFVRESLKTDSQGEVLMMKTNIVKQVKELTSPFQAGVLEPNTKADVEFLTSQDMISKVQHYGQVFSPESPDPSKCLIIGEGWLVATVEEKAAAILQVADFKGEPVKSINSLKCELVSDVTGTTERGTFRRKGQNQYEISYHPTIKGKHKLHIKVEDTHVRGSPFAVVAKMPVQKLGTPILSIDTVDYPDGVAVNEKGELVVTEEGKDHVSISSPIGEKVLTFGSHGSGEGEFNRPRGVAVDGEGNILVADSQNHRIQKFTAKGQFLSAVGTFGKRPLQFNYPSEVTFNATNNKLYVADKDNHRVQVLNSDLSFSSTFGREGSGKGQFSYQRGIACDSMGKVYVADCANNRIQVFTAEGQFCMMFGKCELKYPAYIAIDSNDFIYVSEIDNNCVSVFTSEGQIITSFGCYGERQGELKHPRGVAVDSDGVVYVCDIGNNRIQVY